MTMKKKALFLSLLALIFLSTQGAIAATGHLQKNDPTQPIVSIKPIAPQKNFHPGDKFELILELTISPGFHINSQNPEDDLLVPTSVEFKEDPAFEVKEIIFPETKTKKFKFSEKPLSVYEGQVEIKARIELGKDARPDSLDLAGQIRYQACDEQACLKPTSTSFKAKIKVLHD